MKCVHLLTVAAFFFTGSAFAQPDIQLIGKIQQPLPRQVTPAAKTLKAKALPTSVTLLKIQLSDHAWTKLQARAEETEHDATQQALNTPITGHANRVQLGMNNVPVLDQGPHSTCATFATTAAIDAVLNHGDDISELCQLQLGRHLEKNGYTLSGWDGSMGPVVLNQMQAFGFVSKTTQREKGCSGFTEYPTRSNNEPEQDMSLAEYHAISEALPEERVSWSSILDAYQVFIDKTDPNKTLQHVIAALNAGDRLTFGVLLFDTDQGIAGAVGKYHASSDTWVITPEIIKNINDQGSFGGHEMIITGYDDEAVAIDTQGKTHKGLLTLRNSWGDSLGDKGDFYMSYDYFKTLTIEVQRIRGLS